MRGVLVAVLLVAALLGATPPARAFIAPPPPPSTATPVPPLVWYGVASIGCATVSPMAGTLLLGRELTVMEVDRMTLSCFLGPLGWVLGPQLFPDPVLTALPPNSPNQPPPRQARGRHIDIPPRGLTAFVPNEILWEVDSGAPAQYAADVARRLGLTLLETQSFSLTGRTLQRWRIDANSSVRGTLGRLLPFTRITAQPNFVFRFGQAQPPAQTEAGAQYVVPKLHLMEAHKITSGDDVLVAVIDSKIDASHPDLAGVIVDQYDALGGDTAAHMHGTGMAGAIAAHTKLLGVAPKVKLLAVHAFSGDKDGAQGTTFSILKGLDWAASKQARIVNMSFAGPPDPMLTEMLGKAHARGMVLIAAVGNAGPRAPPMYPAADRVVIGVTATDADDKLLPQANRGPQVAIAAPGVMVLEPAPDGGYQVTTGTSVAAAHASGVAALLLARNPKLTPDQVRGLLVRSARAVPGAKRDIGAGVIDALAAVDAIKR
ncbi:MAG TPA: S8 family serine peptidase [Pseudolabrys sp.]|nr:S8 family serine peptidase [Pseudolabrys sp.]